MTRIDFRPGVPVDLVLAAVDGRPCHSRYKGDQMEFRCADGRSAYVPIAAGHEIQARLRNLAVQPGERILITMHREHGPAGAATTWEVHAIDRPVGAQRDGSFVVPTQPGTEKPADPILAPQESRREPAQARPASRPRAEALLAGTKALVDVYAAAVAYGEVHGVSRSEVLALLLSIRRSGVS